ncbi:YeiH family protein [Micromonospora terminaliae]|uniref:YeiH family protein n=1 Tax=Micromonospora terminaliae TaxID=1914461 RepID=UPI001FCB5C07|nr:putative sulfate exporter family transporter [Micromonospora terminaliae]
MLVLADPPSRRRAPVQATGLGAAVVLGLAAAAAGALVPVVGAPVFAVVAGAVLSPLARRRSTAMAPGLHLAKGLVLQVSVVLLGAQLSLSQVLSVGAESLPVMLGTLGVCLLLARVVGRRLGVPRDLRTLIGVGTGICGASAIAAATPAIRAKSNDVAYAISTIFLFNVAAVLVFPPLGHALGLDAHAFGLFAGTAVNDTSSVVAAAGVYGQDAVGYAVVVKLVRTLMIIPVVLVLTTLNRRRADLPETAKARLAASLVPWFLVAFLAVAALNTGGLIPGPAQAALRHVTPLFIAVALAGVGLSTDVAALRRAGARPLLLGLILWAAVSFTSLGLQWLPTR